EAWKRIRAALAGAYGRAGFRLVHFSVQHNHVHLIVEADDNRSLSCGVQSIAIRMARSLNRWLRRTGKVFVERYHAHVLKTPSETRAALAYVILNLNHHFDQRGRRP